MTWSLQRSPSAAFGLYIRRHGAWSGWSRSERGGMDTSILRGRDNPSDPFESTAAAPEEPDDTSGEEH